MLLLDKITSRIESWTARNLSFAGWLQFFIAFRFNWSSIFILIKNFIKAIAQILSSYLWKGKELSGAKVSWDVVCKPKRRWIRFERGARMELRNHNETYMESLC